MDRLLHLRLCDVSGDLLGRPLRGAVQIGVLGELDSTLHAYRNPTHVDSESTYLSPFYVHSRRGLFL